jgi:hypothetical protein
MDTVRIPLTQGKFALVDAEDAERVNTLTWHFSMSGSGGYARAYVRGSGRENRRLIRLHRFVLDLPDGVRVDHENGDRLDCRKSNLRPATHAQNNLNRPGVSGGTSQYKGVHKPTGRNRWVARIKKDGRHYDIGTFGDEVSAARAYDAKALELFGAFAWLNFPSESEAAR